MPHCLKGQTPCGIAHYLEQRHCWHVENVFYLQDLFVTEDARGKGLGRALINAVADIARANGSSSLYWMTRETNHAARALYDSMTKRDDFVRYQMPL